FPGSARQGQGKSMKVRPGTIVLLALAQLAGCGGGGGGGGTPPPAGPASSTYTIGGAIAGLTGSGLMLRLNASENLPVNPNATAFTFNTQLASGAAYVVSVFTQPTNPSQACTVSNGSGTVGSANVTNISISCATNSFTVGGTVTGLTGSGLVLQNNGGNNLPIGNGAFIFSAAIPSGVAYAVAVVTQPTNPSQQCSGHNGSGTVASANVTNISISCATNSFTVGGTVSGLTGTGLVLRNNGGNDRAISGNGAFTFSTPILSGATYAVTVFTQPTGPVQNCNVT